MCTINNKNKLTRTLPWDFSIPDLTAFIQTGITNDVKYIYMKLMTLMNSLREVNLRSTGLNGHLSIRDFTLTSCQRGSYQQPHHRINIKGLKGHNDVELSRRIIKYATVMFYLLCNILLLSSS